MKFKYLVVDDELMARKLIMSHCSKIESLQLRGECSSAIEAANVLRTTPVDLIFLDIQMPQLTGLDFLKALRNPPSIIITTAYRDYAVDAFDLDVVDYLVKPISFERLLRSVNKFFQLKEAVAPFKMDVGSTTIQIKSDRKLFQIDLSEIVYIESLDDYVRLHLRQKNLVTREAISALEEKLPEEQFVRIHRSFIVSKKFIEAMTSEYVVVAGKELPFGRAFKQSALARISPAR